MSWYVNGYVYRPQRALKHRAGEVGPVISDDAKADVSWMQSTLQRALDGTHLSAPEKDHFQQRMHFATDPVPDSSTWIPRLLEEWTTSRKVITVSTQPGAIPPHHIWRSSITDIAVVHDTVRTRQGRADGITPVVRLA